ncbi:MAG: 30S ribosomal protein S4e [Candidatus Nanohaloarchaeota archaeon QJJ-5]|nr:30S ribosomal protein S4e [Candidatus Nanohaloarchaeota archaeon QJJ-5]
MAHQKRLSAPQHYPIKRKENTYIVKGSGPHTEDTGFPLRVLLREVLDFAKSADEVDDILQDGNIQVNGRLVDNAQLTVGFMDVISIDKIDTDYRVLQTADGLAVQEIDDSGKRLYRVEDKTTLKGGITQLNLDAGENIETEEDFETQSSLLVDLDDATVEEEFELTDGNAAYITGGQHVGTIATIVGTTVVPGSQSNKVQLETDDGETFETVEEFVYVVGDDDPAVEL